MQEQLKFLLDKYNINTDIEIIDKKTVKLSNEIVSTFPWRYERRFTELKNIVDNHTVNGISHMRVCRIESKGANLSDILYRELDLCEWILSDKIIEIFAVKTDNAINAIAKMKSSVICTLEVATTLAENAEIIDKHEIIAQQGIACDRVVDTQVPQSSIYVYKEKEEPEKYLDVDFELYGLSIEDVAIVRSAFELAKNTSFLVDLRKQAIHLKNLILCVEKSVETISNIEVK